nr:MAG TPA: hypothetical protein [Caudoviricetes sp.]
MPPLPLGYCQPTRLRPISLLLVARCLLRLYLAFANLDSSYLFVVGSPSAVASVSYPLGL